MKKYKLYALRQSEKNINSALKEKFYRITGQYILVYTTKKRPENAVKITDKDINQLTVGDYIWLQECNKEIIDRETEKNMPKVEEHMRSVLERLENELANEKAKINEQSDAGTEQS